MKVQEQSVNEVVEPCRAIAPDALERYDPDDWLNLWIGVRNALLLVAPFWIALIYWLTK